LSHTLGMRLVLALAPPGLTNHANVLAELECVR